MIGRVRRRETFAALARAPRRRRGVVTMRVVVVPDPTRRGVSVAPQVAYSVGRAVGGAVARNRVRRRLRAVVRSCEGMLVPGRAYLVGVGSEGARRPFRQLVDEVRELCADAAGASDAP